MKICILHLSDLHITIEENEIVNITQKIKNAINISSAQVSEFFIVVSGDITDKGDSNGYKKAECFFNKLRNAIEDSEKKCNTKIILVPGNHDCNFKTYNKQTRINTIPTLSYENLGGTSDNSVIDLCLEPQKDFWDFYSKYNDIPENKLLYLIKDNSSDITFICLNTAWDSTQKETPEKFFPVQHFSSKTHVKTQYSFSVFHHTLYWFKSDSPTNNRREIQKLIEKNSTVTFVGHEHEPEERSSYDSSKPERHKTVLSGSILGLTSGANTGGFSLLCFDLNDDIGKLQKYIWNGEIFTPSGEATNISLKSRTFTESDFDINQDYIEKINRMPIPLAYTDNETLKLSDYYVFPDLEPNEIHKDDLDKLYNSQHLIQDKSHKLAIVEGESQSGKTGLAVMLFLEAIKQNIMPLMLDLSNHDQLNTNKLISTAFCKQYICNDISVQKYIQEDKSRKIALIDNLQIIQYKAHEMNQFLSELEKVFGKIIVLSEMLYGNAAKIHGSQYDISRFTIRSFGYLKRNELIERFHKVTEKNKPNKEHILELTKRSFEQVELIIGEKLMPSYPVYLLSILQAFSSTKTGTLDQTSFGYCYNSLIYISLARNAKIDPTLIDTYYNFLGEFAFHLFKQKRPSFTEEYLENFYNDYRKKFHSSFSFRKLFNSIIDSSLLISEDSKYKFSYKYIFYYLIAKRIAEMISKDRDAGKKVVIDLCNNLHDDEKANILLFVVHHSKDPILFDEALLTTLLPFEDIEPISLEKRGTFYKIIQNIVKESRDDIIEAACNPLEKRQEILSKYDQQEGTNNQLNSSSNPTGSNSISESLMPFIQAVKAIEIVGQIVRNRKGSLEREKLLEMIIEIYNVAFRTISYFGKLLDADKSEYLDGLLERIKEKDTRVEIELKMNQFFYFLSFQVCLGVFSRIIKGVGQSDLKDLFNEAAEKIGSPAADLVTFSINSYYSKISKTELKNITKKYHDNPVVMKIIKSRVKSYLYQNYVDYKNRQSFAEILDMKIKPQALDKA